MDDVASTFLGHRRAKHEGGRWTGLTNARRDIGSRKLKVGVEKRDADNIVSRGVEPVRGTAGF